MSTKYFFCLQINLKTDNYSTLQYAQETTV